MSGAVLVVDDDRPVREALVQTLELADWTVRAAGSFIEARDHIARDYPGVILSDIRMPGRDGFHLLAHARQVDPDLPVILLTGEGDIPMAVKAMGEGAFDFLEKPCAPEQLLAVLERALKNRALVLENRRLKAQLETGDPAAAYVSRAALKLKAADAINCAMRIETNGNIMVLEGTVDTPAAKKFWAKHGPRSLSLVRAAKKDAAVAAEVRRPRPCLISQGEGVARSRCA